MVVERYMDIVCKICNWKWIKELDDTNPYLCHKCGYDNETLEFDYKSLEEWIDNQYINPFTEDKLDENTSIRTFSKDTEDMELIWHIDREDRLIKVIEGTGWKFQLDNKLPIVLEKDSSIFIPKGEFHRVIKDSECTDLIIEIVFKN